MATVRRVLVVGAGPSGLVSLKECRAAGIDAVCYDAQVHDARGIGKEGAHKGLTEGLRRAGGPGARRGRGGPRRNATQDGVGGLWRFTDQESHSSVYRYGIDGRTGERGLGGRWH